MSSKKSVSKPVTTPGIASVVAFDPSEILTRKELAQRLKVEEGWVREKSRRRCSNPIPVMSLGKLTRYHWGAVCQWMARNTRGVAA